MSAVHEKYVSTPIHSVEFPQKNRFLSKPGLPLSALIILDWGNLDLLYNRKRLNVKSPEIYEAEDSNSKHSPVDAESEIPAKNSQEQKL